MVFLQDKDLNFLCTCKRNMTSVFFLTSLATTSTERCELANFFFYQYSISFILWQKMKVFLFYDNQRLLASLANSPSQSWKFLKEIFFFFFLIFNIIIYHHQSSLKSCPIYLEIFFLLKNYISCRLMHLFLYCTRCNIAIGNSNMH